MKVSKETSAKRRDELVGALVLARTAATPQLRDEILGAARNRPLEMPRK